jgi:hypothetical protein
MEYSYVFFMCLHTDFVIQERLVASWCIPWMQLTKAQPSYAIYTGLGLTDEIT